MGLCFGKEEAGCSGGRDAVARCLPQGAGQVGGRAQLSHTGSVRTRSAAGEPEAPRGHLWPGHLWPRHLWQRSVELGICLWVAPKLTELECLDACPAAATWAAFPGRVPQGWARVSAALTCAPFLPGV